MFPLRMRQEGMTKAELDPAAPFHYFGKVAPAIREALRGEIESCC